MNHMMALDDSERLQASAIWKDAIRHIFPSLENTVVKICFMQRQTGKWAICISLLLMDLLGCIHMTYEAPGPPDEEIAILEYDWMQGFYLWRMDTLKVTHIDDVEIRPWSDVALMPGSHRISFAYEEMAQGLIPYVGTVPIWLFVKARDLILEAEAGHT